MSFLFKKKPGTRDATTPTGTPGGGTRERSHTGPGSSPPQAPKSIQTTPQASVNTSMNSLSGQDPSMAGRGPSGPEPQVSIILVYAPKGAFLGIGIETDALFIRVMAPDLAPLLHRTVRAQQRSILGLKGASISITAVSTHSLATGRQSIRYRQKKVISTSWVGWSTEPQSREICG
jgi:hypothetical protein